MASLGLDRTFHFLQALERCRSGADVAQVLRRQLEQFGIEYIMAGVMPATVTKSTDVTKHLILSTLPEEWAQRYVSQRYMNDDPAIKLVQQERRLTPWSQIATADDTIAARVMNEARECGVGDGITMTFRTLERRLGGFSVSGERLEVGIEDVEMIHFMCSSAFNRLLVLNANPHRYDVKLGRREHETLLWLADGKTTTEIADLMGITEHGVDRNIRFINKKLGTASRIQSVVQAVRIGLIS